MLALAYVDDRLFEAGIEGGPVAWLHDEIVLEVREDQAERAAEILKQSMIDGFAETFPARRSMGSSSRTSARTGARQRQERPSRENRSRGRQQHDPARDGRHQAQGEEGQRRSEAGQGRRGASPALPKKRTPSGLVLRGR